MRRVAMIAFSVSAAAAAVAAAAGWRSGDVANASGDDGEVTQ